MNKEQVDLLGEYIKAGKSAVLIEEIPESVIEKGAVVTNSDCSSLELMGHYDNLEYVAPEWYGKLIESSKTHTPVLIIKDINKIPEEEQRKLDEGTNIAKKAIVEILKNGIDSAMNKYN